MQLLKATTSYGSGNGVESFKELYIRGVRPREAATFVLDDNEVRAVLSYLQIAPSYSVHPNTIYEKNFRVIQDETHTDYGANAPYPSTRTVVWARPRAKLPIIHTLYERIGVKDYHYTETTFWLLGVLALADYYKAAHFNG